VLEVRGLKLTLNSKPVINDLNLEVNEGKIHGLLGVNGTGKTTLTNLIMGITYPDEGSIIFGGRDITRCTISERARMGITLAWQEPARFEGLSVGEYLNLGRNLSLSEIERYLWMVGLPPVEYLNRAVDATLNGITEMSKQGPAVLLITHSEGAVGVADKVSLMCAGEIINAGEPEEMCQWFKDNCQTCNHIGEPDYKET
jgi:Fe-S cluster assembly ATP-binding protein